MYLLERNIWAMQNDAKARQEMELDTARSPASEENLPGIKDCVSEHPCAERSLYSMNDDYIEVYAGALQHNRGFITCFFLPILFGIWTMGSTGVLMSTAWFTGTQYWLNIPATQGDYIAGILLPLFVLGMCWVTYRYLWRFIRLENFVQRRLLIRFNRITRQVYLHRPQYAGGVTTLAWDQISPEPMAGNPEWQGMSGQLVLLWENDKTDLPFFHMMFVGKVSKGTSEITNLWEFIRRYMEEGPQSVPKPKKFLSKIPWPWQSLEAPWTYMRPMWRSGLKRHVLLWTILLAPVMLIHATIHWLSLLLCWEPRWPRIIREAGRPGKPVPPLSTAADWPPPPAPLKPLQTRKPRKKTAGSTKPDATNAKQTRASKASEKAGSSPQQKDWHYE